MQFGLFENEIRPEVLQSSVTHTCKNAEDMELRLSKVIGLCLRCFELFQDACLSNAGLELSRSDLVIKICAILFSECFITYSSNS